MPLTLNALGEQKPVDLLSKRKIVYLPKSKFLHHQQRLSVSDYLAVLTLHSLKKSEQLFG